MGRMIFDILETNIAVSIGIALLCLFAGKLRRRYGAVWMKAAWVLLAVRLLIPYNYSLSSLEIRLLNYAGFEQERELAAEDAMTWQGDNLAAGVDAKRGNKLMAGDETGQGDLVTGVGTEQTGQSGNQVTETAFGQSGDQGIYTDGNLSVDWNTGEAGHSGAQGIAYNAMYHNDNANNSMTGVMPSVRSAFFYTGLLIKIWFAGAVVSLIYYVFSYLLFSNRCRRNLYPITDTNLIWRIGTIQNKYIGQSKIMAYQSTAFSTPMITGIIRPKLILPADKIQWNVRELELIMAHELCHYRNKDLWLKMLMVAACCINWFNPMVYVMKKQFAYEMELACDGSVLADRDEEERENYARTMLMFAGSRRDVSAFSTGFGGNRKWMKTRIDYMLDTSAKKKGTWSIVLTAAAVLVMGILVSCGCKAGEENGESGNRGTGDGSLGNAEQGGNFDYNHGYNGIIRCYYGDLYLAKEDGIYYLKDGQGEEELLYSNLYDLHRGMEIDGRYLYFCGAAPIERGGATVYCMDLNTHEVVDALAVFSMKFSDFNDVSVYEGNLYVAVGDVSERIGFELDENGVAVRQLDAEAGNFLYREYNDYVEIELERRNAETEEEYLALTEEYQGKYQAVMDVASCKKLLKGRQVVGQYKDESLISIYLEDEDGIYEYVCDTTGFPMLVTETGLYYPDFSGEIRYADFETKQNKKFYVGTERVPAEISLITYDADYVYLLENKIIGNDMDDNSVTESYLIRVPRAGGEAQKVYRFKDYVRAYGEDGCYRHCGVYDGRMYFDNRESFWLEPDVNKIQAVNGAESSEAAVEMTRAGWSFAEAYLKNDEKTLRSLLVKDFEGTVEMYAYPGQADRIMKTYVGKTYIGGGELPSENIAVGVTGYVYYTFGGHPDAGDAEVCMTIRMIKTEDGFRVDSYEVVM